MKPFDETSLSVLGHFPQLVTSQSTKLMLSSRAHLLHNLSQRKGDTADMEATLLDFILEPSTMT
jgi:hypothetical protein